MSMKRLSFTLLLILAQVILPLGTSARADELTQLNGAQLTAAMGTGWNLGNQLEANRNGVPSETAWGNPAVSPALIKAVKAAGFRTIRVPVSYLSFIGAGPDYRINPKWLARVKEVVDYAYNEGLYVIINIHGDGYNTIKGAWMLCNARDQEPIRAKYKAVWEQIASTFSAYNERLIFESMNEEFDGVTYGGPVNRTYYANLNAYNQIFVDTVRQTGGNNASRWLLIAGWNTNIDQTTGNYGFVLPTDDHRSNAVPTGEKRILISVHYYAPWDFCGDERSSVTQWGAKATKPARVSKSGQEAELDAEFKKVAEVFVAQGYPFVVGEYGAIDKSHRDPENARCRAAFVNAVCVAAHKYGGVPVVWDEGYTGKNGFGLIKRSTGAVVHPEIVDAIMAAEKR